MQKDEPQAHEQTNSEQAASLSNDSGAIFQKLMDPASFRFPPNWDFWLQVVTQSLFEEGVRRSARMFLDAAVRDATLHLEERLRELTDAPLTTIGTELVDFAFHPESGFLTDPNSPSAERQGLYLLYKGVVLSLRNPVGHRKTNFEPRIAYDAIALVDYLLETANRAALERLVFPFMTRLDVARSLSAVHRVDLDNDGVEELIVVAAETDAAGHRTRILVLRGSPPSPIPGHLPTIEGAINPVVNSSHDFDDDGICEVFVSATSSTDAHSAMLIDFDGERVREIGRADGRPLLSTSPGFQVLRPAELGGRPTVVGFDHRHRPTFWVYSDGELAVSQDVNVEFDE